MCRLAIHIGYLTVRRLTLEQFNVHSEFKDELEKWQIDVIQRGISAPQVIRKQNRKAQIAQSKIERVKNIFSAEATPVSIPFSFKLSVPDTPLNNVYHVGSFFVGARPTGTRQNSIIPHPAHFVK